jgi:hypothetical protein
MVYNGKLIICLQYHLDNKAAPQMAKSVYSSPARGIAFKYAGQHGAVKGRPSLGVLLANNIKVLKRALKYSVDKKSHRYSQKKTKHRR